MKDKVETEPPYDKQALELADEDDELDLVMGEDGIIRELLYV